ncbi:MAG: hypothetical protein ABSG75_06025 [Syntrophales bacterium]|jgi:hypothetical protein
MKDNVKTGWMNWKLKAGILGRLWVAIQITAFSEPERAGTPKGEAIGFSRAKKKASLLTILYPTLSLKEIAKEAGTTEGVLRVWRTQEEFKAASEKACRDFGDMLANTIDIIIRRQVIDRFRRSSHGIICKTYDDRDAEDGDDEGVIQILKSKQKENAAAIKALSNKFKKHRIAVIDDSEELFKRPNFEAYFKYPDAKKFLLDETNFDPNDLPYAFASLIPFYNRLVLSPFINLCSAMVRSGVVEYVALPLFGMKAEIKNRRELQKWRDNFTEVGLTKERVVESLIDDLTDPCLQELREKNEDAFNKLIQRYKDLLIRMIGEE